MRYHAERGNDKLPELIEVLSILNALGASLKFRKLKVAIASASPLT
jgi:hypothetical protein